MSANGCNNIGALAMWIPVMIVIGMGLLA